MTINLKLSFPRNVFWNRLHFAVTLTVHVSSHFRDLAPPAAVQEVPQADSTSLCSKYSQGWSRYIRVNIQYVTYVGVNETGFQSFVWNWLACMLWPIVGVAMPSLFNSAGNVAVVLIVMGEGIGGGGNWETKHYNGRVLWHINRVAVFPE